MALSNQIRPYEVHKGEADTLVAKWTTYLSDCFAHNRGYIGWAMKRNLNRICAEFAEIETRREERIKVGIVGGEIYMKYSPPLGNNHLQEYLEEQGCEVMVPPSMMGFLYYGGADNAITDRKYYGGRFVSAKVTQFLLRQLYKVEKMSRQAMMKSGKFTVPIPPYTEMKKT